ncbi:addiction module antidote protein, HigA family [Jiella endophytica]|uniref:Addiction module antidote protein, HigA family n=1 Tax=Jiella endophytica TaxID=2558362 RepID=A0A4Y8RI66_9HYPH|nr:HigA family addiction module antitoxin [Jiella endophytica]TFF22106.1 addiction module antidote protein, HigA family [Jiella endophytica]
MAEYNAVRGANRCPSHPGALLADLLADIGQSKAEIARSLDISRQHLYDILNESKPVTPNVAARLGTFFGDGAGVWLRMQAAHDAWHAERDVDVSRVKKLGVA